MTGSSSGVMLENVSKRFGALDVIHDVSIGIEDGEFVILVGPSGCGKSTLLRMIAGLEAISGGSIEIAGKRVNDLAPKERDIAMVFQNYALYPHMTVAENMGFSMRLQRVDKAEMARKVEAAAAVLGLSGLLGRFPRELSGGQRQRVAMGRAIVRDPKVFLFDEPLSNLDAKLRVAMRTEIKDLQHRLGTTTIYVTHDQIEAMTMADRIVVMQNGRVEQMGAPLELYDRPVNRFVASFIGSPSMNFIDGRVEGGTSPLFRTQSGDALVLPGAPTASEGRPMVYGIRPEHLEIAGSEAAGSIGAEVIAVEPTGSETMVVAKMAGTTVHAVFRERHAFAPGTPIHLRPVREAAHLFDAETGRAA